MTKRTLEDVRILTREILATHEAKQAILNARRDEPAVVGDVYLVAPLPDDLDITWLLISLHPDDPDLFLGLPVDSATCLVGACDVVLNTVQVARGGCGSWLPRARLRADWRMDIDRFDWAQRCRQRVAQLARGQAIDLRGAEDDPNYQEHLQRVQRAVALVEKD